MSPVAGRPVNGHVTTGATVGVGVGVAVSVGVGDVDADVAVAGAAGGEAELQPATTITAAATTIGENRRIVTVASARGTASATPGEVLGSNDGLEVTVAKVDHIEQFGPFGSLDRECGLQSGNDVIGHLQGR